MDAAHPDLGDFSVRRVLSPERGVESEAGQSINIPEQRVESRVACEQSPGSLLIMKPAAYLATSACLLSSGLAQEFLFNEVSGNFTVATINFM